MQRIVIKNFGPIKDVDIPIHDFMIFIGPQASGKSTIAKAIGYFREFLDLIYYDTLEGLQTREKDYTLAITTVLNADFEKKVIADFHQYFPSYLEDRFSLQYFFKDNHSITISNVKKTIEFIYSPEVLNLIEVFKENALNETIEDQEERDAILSYRKTRRVLNDFLITAFDYKRMNVFIPAGRSIFSTMANQIRFIKGAAIDDNIASFADIINDLRRYGKTTGLHNRESFSPSSYIAIDKIKAIIKGDFINDHSLDFISISEIKKVLLNNASSGQQESIWLLLCLLDSIDYSGNFLIIEEPEAHLYPEAQKIITELIILCLNEPNNQILVTTHSPYILGALNNLLYANNVGQKHPEKVNEVVDKNLWLDYDRVMAYFVDEGKVRSIMDEELKMIKNEEIDSASRIINQEYDSLSDIEYSK